MSEAIDKHSRMPRKYLANGEPQPRSEEGVFLSIPEERKQACLADVKPMLLSGADLPAIAAKHNISVRTLNYWLAQMGDEYKAIRRQWLDTKLASAEDRMESADDPFQLAKGRELARMAMWWAERRDPDRYADKKELTVKDAEPTDPEAIRKRITDLETRLGVRTIDGQAKVA